MWEFLNPGNDLDSPDGAAVSHRGIWVEIALSFLLKFAFVTEFEGLNLRLC